MCSLTFFPEELINVQKVLKLQKYHNLIAIWVTQLTLMLMMMVVVVMVTKQIYILLGAENYLPLRITFPAAIFTSAGNAKKMVALTPNCCSLIRSSMQSHT